MKDITLSLNPTYLCNFRCSFCYLTPEQLSDKNKLEISRLEEMLKQIKSLDHNVCHVDLYGGEVGILPESYLNSLHEKIEEYFNPTFNVVTNLYRVNPYFNRKDVGLSVSYDFSAREHSEEVLQNIIKTNKSIYILILASPELIKLDVDFMIKFLSSIRNIKSVEIKPYSSNQANQLNVTNKEYEDFVYKWLESKVPMNFEFTNEIHIADSLDGKYNAFSDNHIYITPHGKFAALEFDKNDNEFFLEFDNFDEYIDWSNKEKEKVKSNPFCSGCEYLGTCLTEHYREVKSTGDSCNGFKGLLDKSKILFG